MKLSEITENHSKYLSHLNEAHPSGLGTTWTAPGEGSTWQELADAFLSYISITAWCEAGTPNLCDRKTNLKLTGAPLTAYDRQRWQSGKVE